MIDLHIHILPGIDDGAPSMDDSLTMADMAVSSGVDTIIMTPHCNIPDYYDNYYSPQLMRAFGAFKRALSEAGIPLQVFPGMEIYTTPDIASLIESRRVIGLNFTKYMLVEFDFGADAEWMTQRLEEILNTGNIPVVAHPERYYCVNRDPSAAWIWASMGCLLQCNKGSFLGSFGADAEETAHRLLDHRLVSFIASDAHRTNVRTPDMQEIYRYISWNYSEETAHRLLHSNARHLCRNEDVPTEAAVPFERKRYWGF